MRSRPAARGFLCAVTLLLASAFGAPACSAALIDLGAAGPERLRASGVVDQVTGDDPIATVGSSFAFQLTVDGDAGRLESFLIDGADPPGLMPFALDVIRDTSGGVLTLQGSDSTFPFAFEFQLVAPEGSDPTVRFASACPGCFIPVPRSELTGTVTRLDVTPVREPAGVGLIALGLCGLLALRRVRGGSVSGA